MSAKALAAILTAAVGMIAVVLGVSGLQDAAKFMSQWGGPNGVLPAGIWPAVCGIAGIPCLSIAIGCVLIFRPPRTLLRLAAAEGEPTPAGTSQAQAILVVGMTLVGIVLLTRNLPMLMALIVANPKTFTEGSWGASLWADLIGYAFEFVLGIYCFFGAPVLSRWLMKRIRQSCAEAVETQFRDAE